MGNFRCLIFTARKRSLGQGNIFASVCHSVHRGEYLTSPRDLEQTPPGTWIRHPPNQVHPPGADTPQDQVHPRSRHPPDQVHPPRTKYTTPDLPGPGTPPGTRYTPSLGPGTPPDAEHAGRYGQHAGGTHPTGMQSCSFLIWTTLINIKKGNFKLLSNHHTRS